MEEGFLWLSGALCSKTSDTAPSTTASSTIKAPSEQEAEKDRLEIMLEEWLTREDESSEEFLRKLRNFTLDVWDHRTHLRIAHTLLKQHERKAGMELIFADTKKFIENSLPPARGAATATRPSTRR